MLCRCCPAWQSLRNGRCSLSKETRRNVEEVQLYARPYLPNCPEKLVESEKEEYRLEEYGDVIIDSFVLTRGNYCLDRRRVAYCNLTRSV